MSEIPQYPGSIGRDVVTPVQFNPDRRYEEFASQVTEFRKDDPHFSSAQLMIDKRTGGIARNERGEPLRYEDPQNPDIMSQEEVILPIEFDRARRHQRLRHDLGLLRKGDQGFLGVHLEIDRRTGGIKRSQQGELVRYEIPKSPFDEE